MDQKLRTKQLILKRGIGSIALGVIWLIAIPLMMGAIGLLYVPIMAPYLNTFDTWLVTTGITILLLSCIILHTLVHVVVARGVGIPQSLIPAPIPVYPFGDATQIWPAAPSPRREMVVASAGPLSNLLLAGLWYLIWDQQWHPYLNVSMIFLSVVNVGLAVINLAPAFPLDGGRLVRVVLWDLLKWPEQSSRLGMGMGYALGIALVLWGVILMILRARFSLELGVGTLLAAGLLLYALWAHPAWQWDRPTDRPTPADEFLGISPVAKFLRGLVALVILLSLTGLTISLLPTVNGLQAPGFAIPVEPMVSVDADHYYPYSGSFILTSVLSQTPITAGQWVYGHLSPVVEIVPPERVVPPDMTPQELMERNFRMLEESETLAKVVALRLAGYDVTVVGEAVKVDAVIPESPAYGVLQPNDLIVKLDGEPVTTASDLAARIRAHALTDTIHLEIQRGEQMLEYTFPLMQPASPDEPPRLGIAVQTVGIDAELPFYVEIEPQKIAGGPSAGLMFTLTVYNMITPEDLTGGRKIAGTGTINLDGRVGPIGGVEQKVAGAERAGAEYFLVPPENYEAAQRVARRIKVVPVATAEEAINFLRQLPVAYSDE